MISVITPVLNGERYIGSCIQNVIEQRCDDIEHIIVNGDSRDSTENIVENYTERYPHIRLLSGGDKGQSNAMNKGIAMARGNVLGILNVDDYYEPNTLRRINNLFESLPEPAMVVGNCNVWDDRGNLAYVNKPCKLKITDLLLGWSINPHPVNPAAYFYHKSLHELVGLYDEKEHYALDLDFLLKAVKVALVHYVNETWGNYRLLKGTKTVIDQSSGASKVRAKSLLEKHRKELSFSAQFNVLAMANLHKIKRKIKRMLNRLL